MSAKQRFWVIRAIGLMLVIGLPLLGAQFRRQSHDRCALDGIRIDRSFEVRVIDVSDVAHRFCCVQCAQWWLRRQGDQLSKVLVIDETSGQWLDADAAYYVRSGVITNVTTGNRVHVFLNRSDAEHHAETSRGAILTGLQRPFGKLSGLPAN